MGNGPSGGIRYVGRGSDTTNDKGAPETSPGTSDNLDNSPQDFLRRNLGDDWGSIAAYMGNGPSHGIRIVGRGSDSTNEKGAPDSSPGTSDSLVDNPQDFFSRNLVDDWGSIAAYLVAITVLCIAGVFIYFKCENKGTYPINEHCARERVKGE